MYFIQLVYIAAPLLHSRRGSVPVKGSKVVTPAFGGENHTYVETRGVRVTDYINTFRDQGS